MSIIKVHNPKEALKNQAQLLHQKAQE